MSEALANIESFIHSKPIEENHYDQYKKCPVFERLQDGSKQKSEALMA